MARDSGLVSVGVNVDTGRMKRIVVTVIVTLVAIFVGATILFRGAANDAMEDARKRHAELEAVRRDVDEARKALLEPLDESRALEDELAQLVAEKQEIEAKLQIAPESDQMKLLGRKGSLEYQIEKVEEKIAASKPR